MADIDAFGDDTVALLLSCTPSCRASIAGAHGEAAAGFDWIHRPPGALRRSSSCSGVSSSSESGALPCVHGQRTSGASVLGLWAIAIVAALSPRQERTSCCSGFYSKESRPTLRSALHRGVKRFGMSNGGCLARARQMHSSAEATSVNSRQTH